MRSAVVADDDPFTVSLVAGVLSAAGFEVRTALAPGDALGLVAARVPDVLISDLDFNADLSGADLLSAVARDYPTVGLVVLTSHQDPQLVLEEPDLLPLNVVYQVKSGLRHVEALHEAVAAALGRGRVRRAATVDFRVHTVTAGQAQVLRQLANGLSTKAIAQQRGTSVRATERLLARLYSTLELVQTDLSDPRVVAVRMWQQGAIQVAP